ncbi:MAG: hypothetical protein E7653_06370 [Ruminococcaceae bacterium]|nr:hypothetical protein [Oscillospiraceae bacterium]
MKKSFKRVLSIALAFVMLALMIPTGVFSATAASFEDDNQIAVYIGSAYPDGVTEADGKLFPTLLAAFNEYKMGTDNDDDYYTIYILNDIVETATLPDNWRANATIKAYDATSGNPTITINVSGGTLKSAWCLIGGGDDLTIENVDFVVADTHGANNALFGMGGACALTLDGVNVTMPEYVNGSETKYTAAAIAMRSEIARAVTLKGECSFKRGTEDDKSWILGWAAPNATYKGKEYTINFDGATINTGAANLINNNATTVINVNVTNGSKLTVGNGAMFLNSGNGKVVVNATSPVGATGDERTSFTSTGSGKLFYSTTQASSEGVVSKAGTVEVNLDNVYIKSTGAQMFHIQGFSSSSIYATLKGTVTNSEMDATASGQYLVRTWGTSTDSTTTTYAHMDLSFVGTTIKHGSASHIMAFGCEYDNIKLSFDGCTIINEGSKTTARLVHSSGANSSLDVTMKPNNTFTANKPDYLVYASKNTTDVKLTLDGWRLHATSTTDNTYQDLAKLFSTKLYYTAKSLHVYLKDCETTDANGTRNVMNLGQTVGVNSSSVAVRNDFFNNLIGLGATPPATYTVTLDNTYMSVSNTASTDVSTDTSPLNTRGMFAPSGTKGASFGSMSTYNINILNGSSVITTESVLFANRQSKNTRTVNIKIDNSTVELSGGTSKMFMYNIDNGNYPVKAANITVSGTSVLRATYIMYNTNGADTYSTPVKFTFNGGEVNATTFAYIKAQDNSDSTEITIKNGTFNLTESLIYVNASTGGTVKADISDGTFNLTKSLLIVDATTAGTTTANIYGGTFNGTTAFDFMKTITGGTVNANVYGGTFKTTTGFNTTAGITGGTFDINIYDADFSGSNKPIYINTEANNTIDTDINIYGGKFGNLTTTSSDTLITLRGLEVDVNIYGGDFMRKNSGEQILLEARGCDVNIYGGTFTMDSAHQNAQMIRHGYATTIAAETFVVSATYAGQDGTALKIYGGTFVVGAGAAISAGTSNTNGYLGNVEVYGGVFVKTTEQTTSGYGIVGHKNSQTTPTVSTSSRFSNNSYNILGGIWIAPDTDIRAYKYDFLDSTDTSFSYQRGTFNKNADNITTPTTDVSDSYAKLGISEAVWAVVKNYTAEVIVANEGFEQTVFVGDKHFGTDKYFQIKAGTTDDSTSTDLRLLFVVDEAVAGNDEFAEVGFYIAKDLDTAANIVENGAPSSTTDKLYTKVRQADQTTWSPEDGKLVAVLDLTNLKADYYLNDVDFYVVAYVKTTSGHIQYTDVYTIDATAACAQDIVTSSAQ